MVSINTEAGASNGGAILSSTRSHLTQLWQVERDSNPYRRLAHVSPFIGKVGPLDIGAIRQIAHLMAATLPILPGKTLIIGLTESSLFLAWFLAALYGAGAELRFTTRYCRSPRSGRTFHEPHSHGPEHFLALDSDLSYAQVVIVEDELTTGATLRNLLLAVRDFATSHYVVTLADLRSAEMRNRLTAEMFALGIAFFVTDISSAEVPFHCPTRLRLRQRQRPNPFGRAPAVLAATQDELRRRWRELRPRALYIIGECVDVALAFWESLPARERPSIQHVTRSPWLVDGSVIRTRLDFGEGVSSCRYFLYNWAKPCPPRALIVGEAATTRVATQLRGFLASQGVAAASIEAFDR
jgi:hypothetical protein